MVKIERKTYTVDAAGKILGRLAADIANHLIGKNNVAFQKNTDCGDLVIVTNSDKLVVTGRKMEQKVYQHHTAHPGGLRTKSMEQLWKEDHKEVLRRAVSRMLPKNKHRTPRLLRLTID